VCGVDHKPHAAVTRAWPMREHGMSEHAIVLVRLHLFQA
jgi:hypothetical protein